MLKRLRAKFIALNMATVGLVLAAVFIAVGASDATRSMGAVHEALDHAIESVAPQPAAPESADAQHQDARSPEIGGKPGGRVFIPSVAYRLDADGGSAKLSAEGGAELSQETLDEAAARLAVQPDGFAVFSDLGLFCQKATLADGSAVAAFVDMGAASGTVALAGQLALVWIAAMIALFLINLAFSRWALRPVQTAWQQQARFLADASHELKTPLTVILANNSILMDNPDKTVASQSQWVESTQTEAARMQELVNDLLFLAKPHESAQTRRTDLARLDFSELVEGDLLQFESVAFERGISIEADIQPALMVEGDAARLHRLTSTLFDNACKYAEPATLVRVELHAAERNRIALTVANFGPAIAESDLERIFDRFYRTDKARARSTGGHGLGLAIAREVAEEHGGSIQTRSSEAEGTVFTVTLPGASG